MAVEPTDIGLATYNDVGDVSQLRTVAKTVVAAINELKQGADIDPIIGDQVYIDGENNVVIGKGNVVKGKNNLVFGSDNIVVGDNVVLFNNKRDVLEAHDFNCCAVNFETHHIICQNPEGLVERNIGDKLVLCIYQNWFNQETEESVIRDLPLQICTITEIVDAMEFVVDDIETDHTPPDEVHTTLDYELGKRCYPLNNSIKYSCSDNAFILGGLAHGKGSLSTNDSESNGQYSFSANQGKANGYNGIAVNRAKCEGEDSFAANTANVYGSGSAGFGLLTSNFSNYSMATGFATNILGVAYKCVAMHPESNSITLEAGQNLGLLTRGNKLYIMYLRGETSSYVYSDTHTIKNVIGNTVFFSDGQIFSESRPTADGYVYLFSSTLTGNTIGDFTTGLGGIVSGNHSIATGYYTKAVGNGIVIFGKYGVDDEDYSLALANGINAANPGLAFKVNSEGNVSADGEFSSPCADYSEYFEWLDGNPNKQDRVGYFVKLNGDKIEKCTDFDKPLGVTSATPAVVGDASELHWQGKYVTDSFGRIQYHDVLIPEERDEEGRIIIKEHLERQPMISTDWNPYQKYVPRKDRPEWSTVGVIGKLIVYDDGTLEAGDVCRCGNNGIAVKGINTGYKVLKRIDENKVLIWFR